MEKITLKAQCAIDLQDRKVQVSHTEYGSFDVEQLLLFGHDLSNSLDTHSPMVAWWGAMVSDERKRLKLFLDGPHLRYMSHCRYFAKLALKGMGDKETLESVKDYVSILFSRDRTKLADTLFRAAHNGHLSVEHQTATAVKKFQESQTHGQKSAAELDFRELMYSWETGHGLTYDDMLEFEAELNKNVQALSTLLEAMQQRGDLLRSMVADKRAEASAAGVGAVRGLAERTQSSMRGPSEPR